MIFVECHILEAKKAQGSYGALKVSNASNK
jgi:hypothetical protein